MGVPGGQTVHRANRQVSDQGVGGHDLGKDSGRAIEGDLSHSDHAAVTRYGGQWCSYWAVEPPAAYTSSVSRSRFSAVRVSRSGSRRGAGRIGCTAGGFRLRRRAARRVGVPDAELGDLV
jgi:hypothetical protein